MKKHIVALPWNENDEPIYPVRKLEIKPEVSFYRVIDTLQGEQYDPRKSTTYPAAKERIGGLFYICPPTHRVVDIFLPENDSPEEWEQWLNLYKNRKCGIGKSDHAAIRKLIHLVQPFNPTEAETLTIK